MASANTVGKVLAEIVLCGFPNFNPTAEMTKVWIAYLSDIDDDLLVMALRHYVSTSRSEWAPSIPKIREAAAYLKSKINGLPDAFEAWEDVISAKSGIRTWAEGDTIIQEAYRFKHPLVKTVAQQLGWPRDFMNDSVTRAHFLKAWEAASASLQMGNVELPEVERYIESRRNGKALPIGQVMDKLEAAK